MGFEKASDGLLFPVNVRGEYAWGGAEQAFEKGDFVYGMAPRRPRDRGGVVVVC